MTIRNWKTDDQLVQLNRGSSIRRDLGNSKVSLVVVQSACALALTGCTRATASEVASKVTDDYGIEVTASLVGQILSGLKVEAVNSHGRSRYMLDHKQLEKYIKEIEAECQARVSKLEEVISTFHELPRNIAALEAEWREIRDTLYRERQLRAEISEARKRPSLLGQLEAEAQRLREEELQIQHLQKECRELSESLKSLPSLEKRKTTLSDAIARHNKRSADLKSREQTLIKKEQDLKKRETDLDHRLKKLRVREGLVNLASLEAAIEETRHELNIISWQLDKKRSLLDRLRRKKEQRIS